MKTIKPYDSFTVNAKNIEWVVGSHLLPDSEEYSIGAPTLIQERVLSEDRLKIDEDGLRLLLKKMLKDDYSVGVRSLCFSWTGVKAEQ